MVAPDGGRTRLARLREHPTRSLRWWWRTTWSSKPLDVDAWLVERRLGWGRLVGGAAVGVSLWSNPAPGPGWVIALGILSAIGLSTSGVVTATIVPGAARPRRLLELLSLLDAVFLSMLLPFGASQGSPFVILVFVLLAVAGSVRLGRFGVLRNLVVAAPLETIRLVVAASMYGARNVEDTVVAVIAAWAIGVLVGDVATTARQARSRATTASHRAHAEGVRARRRAWEGDVLDEVVRAAGTGAGRAALATALDHVRDLLHLADVHLLVAAGPDLLVWASTDPDRTPGSTVVVLPGGPRDRALSLGTVAAATRDDLDRLAGDGRIRGSMVAAPLPVGGRLLGLVVGETGPGDLLHRRDALLLGRLGRTLAPFLWIAGTTPESDASAHRQQEARTDGATGVDRGGWAAGASAEEGVDEGVGVERGKVVDALAQADQLHG